MCQPEIVHKIIVLLSFVQLFFAIPFGIFPFFLLTSLGAALTDTVFVIVQRCNRPRVLRRIELQKKGSSNHGKSIQLPEK